MSLNFTTDNSVQLTYSSFPFTTAILDGYTTSNYVSNVSNLLVNNINTKQPTLTAGTNLLGVGTAITALDYNKITINKPSVFAADMTNIYTKTETNNLLDAKQATLTAATNLVGIGSAITALDYNKITINKPTNFQADYNTTVINKPTYTSPLSSNLATNTISISLASYSTTGNDASYLLKTGGSMTGAIVNTSTTTSEFKAIQFAHTARISHIPYLPNGQIYLRAPVNIDNTDDYLSFGSRIGNNFLRLYGDTFGFGINDGTLRYNVPAGSVHRFYHGTTNTAWIDDTGRLKATIFEGSGASLTNVPYGSITSVPDFLLKTGGTMTGLLSGTTINATTALQEGGTNLTSKYLQLSGGTMTGLLSATTINTTGNVGIGITNPFAPLTIGSPAGAVSDGFLVISKNSNGNRNTKMGYDTDFNFCIGDFGGAVSGNVWRPNDLSIKWDSGNVGIGTSGQSQRLNVNGTTYFNGASTVNGTLTATTFSGSHTGNGSGLTNLPLSAYSTTGTDSSYLLKTGGVMTGQITGVTTLNGTTGIFGTISTTNNTNANTPQLGAFGGTGDRIILFTGTASVHPYSLGINNGVLWYSVPSASSHIFYVAGNPIATISGTSIIVNADFRATNMQVGGTTYQLLITPHTATKNYTEIQTIQQGIGYNQIIALQTLGGNVGIGLTNPNATYKLDINGNLNATLIYEGGTLLTSKYLKLDGTNTMSGALNITSTTTDNQIVITNTTTTRYTSIRFYNGTTSGYIGIGGASLPGTSYYNNNVFLEANNSLIFQSGNQGTGSVPRMIINTSGNVGIATTNPNNIFQVGDGARLKISNGVSSFSLIGTKDVDDGTNTRIVVSGNARAGSLGNIEYVATTSGSHIFYTTDSTTQRMIIDSSGCVGIGTATNASYRLNLLGAINASGNSYSFFGGLRINGVDTGNTIWQETGDLGISANTGNNMKFYIGNGGEKMRIKSNGYVGINNTDPQTHLQVNGLANITNGSPVGTTYMQSGSLTIGGTNANYGCQYYTGGAWSGTNTAGLLLECADNTEIVVHDAGTRLVSMMAYYGGASRVLYIGRAMGWDSGAATPVVIPGNLTINGALDFGSRIQDYIINLWGSGNYGFGINGGTLRYNSDGVHKFYCGGTESSTFTNKGLVIGTYSTQYYPLIVSRTINGTLSYVFVRTGWNGGSDYNTNSYTGDTSASFAGQIHVSGNILNSSDIRIKKEINDITDDGALQQILSIQPKTYKYIDYLSKNNSTVYGFIAQQVKEVIPHAVELVKDIIPNIYKRASCDSNIITLENDVSQDLNINDNIKIYDEFGNDNMYNITEINSNIIKIDKDINTSNVFVFGKEVDDFHTLKKDYIFTLNVCATQELYKLIQKQNEVIEELKNRISILEEKIIISL